LQLQSVNDITPDHRHIFVSPHFDDVAYSCGGTIGKLVNSGERPLVITVFAGIPSFTFSPLTIASKAGRPLGFRVHRGMGFNLSMSLSPAKIIALRRQEDARAYDYLQAEYLWLDYLDGIYRGNARRYANIQQLLDGEVHPDDREISQRLSQDLVKVCERMAGITWYLPLGVGRHVDHQLVSAAAQGLIECGARVKFYEDFPYAASVGALHERLQELGGDFTPTQVEIGGVLSLRIEASALYASQIKMSFGDRNALFKGIKDYACSILPTERVPLERYWSPA
jgi:LmbE family N-acetylglucosaminyl deacetylase